MHHCSLNVCVCVGELPQEVLEEAWGAEFVDLRKSFFLLSGSEAPLVAKVRKCRTE